MRTRADIERALDDLAEGASNDAEIDTLREIVYELLSDREDLAPPCQDGHDGPVVPTGRHEIIDGGIAFYVRCEGCGQEGDCSIDVDEIGWHDD